MGRPKTATNILEARGAFRKNPQRKRPDEPEVDESFNKIPPDFLTDEEVACWNEIISIVPDGVLTGADRIVVEMVARLLCEMRNSGQDFPPTKWTRLSAEMNRIGLSPSSRAGLTVKKKNEFEF